MSNYKNSTTQANIRSGPKSTAGALGHTGSAILALPLTINPSATSATLSINLPEGAIVLGFAHDGGATGGTNPTFNLGTVADPNGYIAASASDAPNLVGINGALAGVATTAAVGLVGGYQVTATAGSITGRLLYVMVDDDSALNE